MVPTDETKTDYLENNFQISNVKINNKIYKI